MQKVLVCDDAAFMRMMLKDILSKNGYEVVGEAANGNEAIQKYDELQPDIVTMDITMPEMDGDECCRMIKTNPSFKGIPVIIYTSSKGEEEKKRCFLAGCDYYLTRPILADELLLKIVNKIIVEITIYGFDDDDVVARYLRRRSV